MEGHLPFLYVLRHKNLCSKTNWGVWTHVVDLGSSKKVCIPYRQHIELVDNLM
jgi:hypothetical protein